VAYTYLNNGGIIISQRQDTISGDANGLNLSPAALAPVAGQPVVRTSGPGDDFFLLVPPAGGFFNLGAIGGSGSTPQLTVYTAAGAVLAQGNSSLYATLAAATPYIVQINNIGSFAAYQFQMTALSSTTIGGAVDYSRLPGSISAAISSATVSAWLDNPSHTQIASLAAVSGNAWSVPVPANAIGQAVRLELTLNLTNSRSISSRIQTVLAASASNLNFFPAAVASGALLNGATGGNGYDRFLFVPATSDLYTLRASSDTYITFRLYDGSTGSFIANSEYRYLSTELMETLEAATPYIIEVSPNWYNFRDYQFFVGLPATLGGTVNFSSLSSWSAASAGILIFGPSGDDYTFLETGAVDLSDGGWSISDLPPAGNVIIALVALSSGGEGVLEAQTLSVTGDDNAINFSPVDADKNLAAGTWHTRSVFAGSGGNWLLWIPGSSGTYVLDAEKIGNIDPYMYLYDGLTGSLIETNDDDGDGNNSRIQRDDFTAGYPYLIRVRDYFSSSGSYRFRAEAVSP
jgi:hypothetical protein